ncbi:MAG: MFS transporter [Rhodospirillaceae bacterium]|nr:MFS transporter [Rhodospirillaceae bacterium]
MQAQEIRVSISRYAALELFTSIVVRKQTLEKAIGTFLGFDQLSERDKGFSRLIVVTTLRRLGQIDAIVNYCLIKELPKGAETVTNVIRLAAAEILFLGVDVYASVDSAVTIVKARRFYKFQGLTNAVLRRLAREGEKLVGEFPEELNFPEWIVKAWIREYGKSEARRLVLSSLEEPALDISVKNNANVWAEKLDAKILVTGSLRRGFGGRIEDMPGYKEGAWWVQDAGAAIPVLLFGNVKGLRVLDACAAPGGKTAQLAAAGADVTAVDRSPKRLKRLESNMIRLRLPVTCIQADLIDWEPEESFDAVLLDPPCTATGTIRRNPDLLIRKAINDTKKLVKLQDKLLSKVSRLVKPHGQLIFCTCSLQPEEGEQRISKFLAKNMKFKRNPVRPNEIGGMTELINKSGDLRTLPSQFSEVGGIDGFFVARLSRG